MIPLPVGSIRGPDGRVPEPGKRLRSSDADQGTSIYELGPGTYTLSFWGENNFSGAYSFALRDLGAATAITPGEAVSATLAQANETRAYAFDAQAGDRVYVDLTARSGGDLRWRLLDPFGNTVFGPATANAPSQDAGPHQLAFAGRYTLLVEGRYNRSDSTSLSFVVRPVSDTRAALELGQVVNASIAKGQTQHFDFSLAGDVRAYFDNLTRDVAGADSFYLRWSLSGTRGTVVADRPFRQSDSVDGTSILDLVAGDYTLSVTSTNELAGNYSFRLADLAQATAIAPGALVEGTLAPSNETDAYRFDAAAGDSLTRPHQPQWRRHPLAAARPLRPHRVRPQLHRCRRAAGCAHARARRPLHAAGRGPLLHRRRRQLCLRRAAGQQRDAGADAERGAGPGHRAQGPGRHLHLQPGRSQARLLRA